jgi:hypothetical protein
MRRRPTTEESLELERATSLTLKAEAALHDSSTVSANDLVRLQRLARQARERCVAMIRSGAAPSLTAADLVLRRRHD